MHRSRLCARLSPQHLQTYARRQQEKKRRRLAPLQSDLCCASRAMKRRLMSPNQLCQPKREKNKSLKRRWSLEIPRTSPTARRLAACSLAACLLQHPCSRLWASIPSPLGVRSIAFGRPFRRLWASIHQISIASQKRSVSGASDATRCCPTKSAAPFSNDVDFVILTKSKTVKTHVCLCLQINESLHFEHLLNDCCFELQAFCKQPILARI